MGLNWPCVRLFPFQDAYWRNLHYACVAGPVGFIMCFFKSSGNKASYWGPENSKLFLILYGITGYFFATKMARLIILMGPIASALSGIALGALANWCIAQFALLIWPEATAAADDGEPAAAAAKDAKTTPSSKASPAPKKGPKVKAVGLSDNVQSVVGAFTTVYRSKRGQRMRICLALMAVLAVPYFGSIFFAYRCGRRWWGQGCWGKGS